MSSRSPTRTRTQTPSHSPLSPDCPAGASNRRCTAFEQSEFLRRGKCACPGYGPRASFSLSVGYVTIAGLLADSPRVLIGVNGSVPGPALIVNEGDWVSVKVTNLLDVPTVIHWHGMLHVGTSASDGVPGVSQCGACV